ncbi:hypothetical protein TSUD_321170 [Trifolium subterraneum]|uniref:Uncharacterized protein n=1 Tax=Trifolium subterraneum TaxID=3900 RepID=A0A2Z6MSB2_TRISU|nr:hypothetical protein TSUD_321170 [Trifolium subterraneum]
MPLSTVGILSAAVRRCSDRCCRCSEQKLMDAEHIFYPVKDNSGERDNSRAALNTGGEGTRAVQHCRPRD